MNRRSVIRIISLFTAALGCLGAWGLGMADDAREARRELRYQGEQAFSDCATPWTAWTRRCARALTP